MSTMTTEQQAFEAKWHMKRVRFAGHHWQIPVKDYVVTAALLGEAKETVFAVMAVDYTRENRHYITFNLASQQLPDLDKAFEILGDYDPIDHEITFRVHGEDTMPDGRDWWLADTVNHANGVTTEGCPLSKAMPLAPGMMLYDVCWTATDGRKLRETLAAPAEIASQGHAAVREHFAKVRQWIRACMYHWVDWRGLPGAPEQFKPVEAA